jgi:hypothetical protein
MFRDSLQRRSSTVFIVFDREIPERHNAHNAFVPIEHRKTTDLVFLHDPLGFLDVLILEAVDDLPSHSFFHGCGLWISPVRDNSNCNIAVSEHSHKAVAVAHGENTHIKRAHLPSGFLDRLLQCDDFHIFCHDTIKLHRRYGWALRGSDPSSHPASFFDMNTKANHLIIASGWEGLGLQRSGFSLSFAAAGPRQRDS